MTTLNGVYTYSIPSAITDGIPGLTMRKITEDPASYRQDPKAEQVNFLIARQGTINDMLQTYPNVHWLQLLNAGFEKVDLGLLRQRSIVFTNARSVYCSTIAEDVMTKILVLSRRYMAHFAQQREHFWPDDDQMPNRNLDIAEKTIGILGAGAIGREIALRAGAFGMHVIGYDPYLTAQEGFTEVVQTDLPGFLSRCDFVITSLPVTTQTLNIINAQTLAAMRPTAFLLNVARGDIIDEDALMDALSKGVIAGAAIDVTKQEPLPADSPLWSAVNLLITPHRAAYGDMMQQRMCALIEHNIRCWLCGQPLQDQVRF